MGCSGVAAPGIGGRGIDGPDNFGIDADAAPLVAGNAGIVGALIPVGDDPNGPGVFGAEPGVVGEAPEPAAFGSVGSVPDV